MDISEQVNELRARIAEEKRKWGFDDEVISFTPKELIKKVINEPPQQVSSESEDLKAKLLGLRKK
jgi:hypothetical protein